MGSDETPNIRRDDADGRYVLAEAPDDGYLKFEESDGRLTLIHTEVADRREGEGIGSALVRTAVDDAEERGLMVVPQCNFVASWLERHPERAEGLEIAAA